MYNLTFRKKIKLDQIPIGKTMETQFFPLPYPHFLGFLFTLSTQHNKNTETSEPCCSFGNQSLHVCSAQIPETAQEEIDIRHFYMKSASVIQHSLRILCAQFLARIHQIATPQGYQRNPARTVVVDCFFSCTSTDLHPSTKIR